MDPKEEESRSEAVQTSMDFLFTLIFSKLEHHHKERMARRAPPQQPSKADGLLDTEDPTECAKSDHHTSQKLDQVFPYLLLRKCGGILS